MLVLGEAIEQNPAFKMNVYDFLGMTLQWLKSCNTEHEMAGIWNHDDELTIRVKVQAYCR